MAFEYQNFASLGVNLNRQAYGPLDISNVFKSVADLEYYTTKGRVTENVSNYWYESADKKIVPYPYEGQIVALVANGNVTAYILSEITDTTNEHVGEFTYKEVGKAPELDNATITTDEEGKLVLVGAENATNIGKYAQLIEDTSAPNGVRLTWVDITIPEVEVDDKSIEKDSEGKISIYGFEELDKDDDKKLLRYNAEKDTVEWVPISEVVEGDTNTITRGDDASTKTLPGEGENELILSLYGFDKAEAGDVPVKGVDGKLTYVNLEDTIAKAISEIPEQIDYTVTVSTENVEDTNFKHYVFTQRNKEIAHIDIPKDLVVSSGDVIVATEDDKALDSNVVIGETYIKLIVANQEKPLYIAAKDLVDIYTAKKEATQVQIAINENNEISATIVAGSIGTTELSEEVNALLALADSAVQKIELTQDTLPVEGGNTYHLSVDGTIITTASPLAGADFVRECVSDALGDLGEDNVKTYVDKKEITILPDTTLEGGIESTLVSLAKGKEIFVRDIATADYVSNEIGKAIDNLPVYTGKEAITINDNHEIDLVTNETYLVEKVNEEKTELTLSDSVIASLDKANTAIQGIEFKENGPITGTVTIDSNGQIAKIDVTAIDESIIANLTQIKQTATVGSVEPDGSTSGVVWGETYLDKDSVKSLDELLKIVSYTENNENYTITGVAGLMTPEQAYNLEVTIPAELDAIRGSIPTVKVQDILIGDKSVIDTEGNVRFNDAEFIQTSTDPNRSIVGIKEVNVRKLTQTKGDWLILNGGDAALTWSEG